MFWLRWALRGVRSIRDTLLRRSVKTMSARVAAASAAASAPTDYRAKEREVLQKARQTLRKVQGMIKVREASLIYLEALKKQAELEMEEEKREKEIQERERAVLAAPTTAAPTP